ncbi:Protein of unknown function [Bacillus cereus]|nr:Protein of unknown function [Bacillus cereus]
MAYVHMDIASIKVKNLKKMSYND